MDYIFVKSQKTGNENHGSIYARIRNGKTNRKYAIGFSISSDEWEKYRSGKFSSKETLKSIGISYGKFSNALEQIRQEMDDSFDPVTASYIIESVRDAALVIPTPKREQQKCYEKRYFLEYWEDYIEQFKNGSRTKSRTTDKVSESLTNRLTTLKKKLAQFEEACECRLTLEDIDINLLNELVNFFRDSGLHINTITSYLELIHAFMHRAFEDNLTRNDIYLYSGFVTAREETDQVYLTNEQIQQMIDIDISSPKKIIALIEKTDFKDDERKQYLKDSMTKTQAYNLMLARDIFIVGCLTGQRISDYSRINKGMYTSIQGKKFIMLEQKKTKKLVYIPLDSRVRQIISKYHGALPFLQRATVAMKIKLIAELLGWTWNTDFDDSRMGRKYGPRFCDMISTHTARRSFATNAYKAGVPLASIMAVTGHESEKKLRAYLRLDAEEKGIKAAMDLMGLMQL